MKIFFFAVVLSTLIVGCTEDVTSTECISFPIKEKLTTDWLVGKWKYEEEDGVLYENWSRKNDTLFVGESFFIEKGDTVFFESVRLKRSGDSLFYESFGDNKITPEIKVFKGFFTSENSIEVENHQQEFPRKVRYNYLNDTLMMIEVSGIIDGSEEVQPYQMTRIE